MQNFKEEIKFNYENVKIIWQDAIGKYMVILNGYIYSNHLREASRPQIT